MKNRLLSLVFLLFATNAIAQVLPPMGSGGAASGGGDALTTNPLSQFAPTTSAQLLATITNATGTGAAVFGTAPTFTTNITVPVIKSATTVAIQTNGTTQAVLFGTDQSATFANGVVVNMVATGTFENPIKVSVIGSTDFFGIFNNSSTATRFVPDFVGQITGAYTNRALGFVGVIPSGQDSGSTAIITFDAWKGTYVSSASTITTRPLYQFSNNASALIKILAGGTIVSTPITNTAYWTGTGYSITSGAVSMIDLTGTWSTTGAPTAIKMNITNTASDAASLLMDLQASTVSKFSVSVAGAVNAISYKVGGTVGASCGPGVVTSLTVVNGIVTACS